MSELKARMLGETMNEYGCDTKIYLKSETDKEIAELKKACNDKDEWCLYTLKENRHHKYKRCLAMAKWCKIQDDNFFKIHGVGHLQMKHAEYKRTFFRKWHKRWLELAEKFKEA